MIIVAVALLCLLGGFLLGLATGFKLEFKTALREAGVSRDAANLYGRAVRIFRRLAGLAALDGELSGDALSDESRKLITDWLDDYRKLTTKGDPGTVTDTTAGNGAGAAQL